MPSFRSEILLLSLVFAGCTARDDRFLDLGELETLDPPSEVGSVWPGLSADEDRLVLSWQEADADGVWFVKTATLDGEAWSPAHTVARAAEDARFFVNWADYAAVHAVGDGRLAAHWLVRGPEGGYDYGVRVARSGDGGESWTEPWTPHEDGTPTEHGFVSMFPLEDGGLGMVWLDGRNTLPSGGDGHGEASRGAMTLRYRSVAADGTPGEEVLLDNSICDCCQTDAAVSSAGPVVVYRDRTEREIRDIYISRLVDGEWTEGVAVHDDGWVMPACPVNGPAVSARDEAVAVAWFTGADEDPRVQVVFSDDAGATFGAATRVDDGNPRGRVDVVLLEDGSALVSWLERGSETGEVRVRRVLPDGRAGNAVVMTTTSPGRDSGFPQMIQDSRGRIVFAWADTGETRQVRVARTMKAVQ